jgi:hypothetical protein
MRAIIRVDLSVTQEPNGRYSGDSCKLTGRSWPRANWLRRHADGGEPYSRRNARLKAVSAHKAFAALPPDKAKILEQDLIDLMNKMNRAAPASLVVPSEYLEIVVTRR